MQCMCSTDLAALRSTNSPDTLSLHTHGQHLQSSNIDNYAPPLLRWRRKSHARSQAPRCAITNTPTTVAAPLISTCTRTCVRRTRPKILQESSFATTTKRSVSTCENSAHFVQWHRPRRYHCHKRRVRHSDICCTSRCRLITQCWMGGGRTLVRQRRIVRDGWNHSKDLVRPSLWNAGRVHSGQHCSIYRRYRRSEGFTMDIADGYKRKTEPTFGELLALENKPRARRCVVGDD
jgi:hypothetical protein